MVAHETGRTPNDYDTGTVPSTYEISENLNLDESTLAQSKWELSGESCECLSDAGPMAASREVASRLADRIARPPATHM